MEELIIAYSSVIPITTARFANVAFSNGSLLDGFIYRLNKRQPLSCPLDIKRFFVTPGQALGYKIGMMKILELRARAQLLPPAILLHREMRVPEHHVLRQLGPDVVGKEVDV